VQQQHQSSRRRRSKRRRAASSSDIITTSDTTAITNKIERLLDQLKSQRDRLAAQRRETAAFLREAERKATRLGRTVDAHASLFDALHDELHSPQGNLSWKERRPPLAALFGNTYMKASKFQKLELCGSNWMETIIPFVLQKPLK
jgi:hypothetical protein